jgi:hypothetical protein
MLMGPSSNDSRVTGSLNTWSHATGWPNTSGTALVCRAASATRTEGHLDVSGMPACMVYENWAKREMCVTSPGGNCRIARKRDPGAPP